MPQGGPQNPYNGGYQGGPPPGYPPPQGGPGYPGGPYGGPPVRPKSNTGLIVSLIVVGVIVAVGAVMFIMSVTDTTPLTPIPTVGAQSSETPQVVEPTTTEPAPAAEIDRARAHAEKYLAAVNAKDEATAISLTCKKERAGSAYVIASAETPASLLPKPRIVEGERVVLDVQTREHTSSNPVGVELTLENGQWCVFT